MDKESKEFCAEADCTDKKSSKKCMKTCDKCKESEEEGDKGGKGMKLFWKNKLYKPRQNFPYHQDRIIKIYLILITFTLDCMDRESEDYCADADCNDKKMAKKCMMTCEICKDMENEDDKKDGKGRCCIWKLSTYSENEPFN